MGEKEWNAGESVGFVMIFNVIRLKEGIKRLINSEGTERRE
jgi:hypothetical protein